MKLTGIRVVDGDPSEERLVPVYQLEAQGYEITERLLDLEAKVEKGGSIPHLRNLLDEHQELTKIRQAGRTAVAKFMANTAGC